MKFNDIISELNNGRLVVWKDDLTSSAMTEEYMKDNFIGVAENIEDAAKMCRDLQDAERDRHGRALTRLRITGAFEDYVCSADSEEEISNFRKS